MSSDYGTDYYSDSDLDALAVGLQSISLTAGRQPGRASSVSEYSSPASAQHAHTLLTTYFKAPDKFVDLAYAAGFSEKDAKLSLWQSFLVEFGVCMPVNGINPCAFSKRGKRPSFLPAQLLPLPTTRTKCRKLIQAYLHINLKDYAASLVGVPRAGKITKGARNVGQVKLFPSAEALCAYTRDTQRYYGLNHAKAQNLNPFLRTINGRWAHYVEDD